MERWRALYNDRNSIEGDGVKERFLKEEGGFSLPELLVTMLMMLTVMFALYSIFDMSLRVFSFGNDKTEAVENARLGLERMEREIRVAYPYDKAGEPPNETLFPSYSSDQITFGNDRNGDRVITVSDEEITYELSGTTLLRNGAPAVEFVQEDGLSFEYLDRFGDTAPSEPDIEIVRITLDIVVERGPQAGTQTLTTDVALRNRGE